MMVTHKPPSDHGADFVTALLSSSMVKALDRYIKEALRQTFKEWCIDRGYIDPNNVDRELS